MTEKLNWDCIQFEAGMEKEISHRKLLGNLSSTKHFSEIRIADQFFIFGIPPNAKNQVQRTILVAYPPFQQANIPIPNVLLFSNPNAEDPNSKSKLSNIFQIEVSAPPSDNGIVDEFVFQYNARSTKMYGACAIVQPSKANKSANNPFFASDNTKKSKFCFCVISKLPIFNVHFTFLQFLIGLSNGLITPKNPPKPKQSSDTQSDSVFEGLEVSGRIAHFPKIKIPDEFRNVMLDHFGKTLFSPPVKFTPTHIIHFPPPTISIPKLLLYSSLDTLLSVLSVSDIVELLTALILDAQVIIIGSIMQEVSMAVYGLSSLLTPFNYCGVVMPILPNNEEYLNLLNSPTPFIYGMPNIAKLRKMSFLESTYIVNLDKHKMTVSNFFPKYPNFKEVVQKITDLINEQKLKTSDSDLFDLAKNRKEKCKSVVVEANKQKKMKPFFSATSIKPPEPPLVADSKDSDNDTKDKKDKREKKLKREDKNKEMDKDKKGKDQKSDKNESSEKSQSGDRVSININPVTKSNTSSNNNEGASNDNVKATPTGSGRMRQRSLTVTHKDFQPDIDQSKPSDPNQLSSFPALETQVSIPEIANDDNPYRFPLEFTKKLNHKVLLSMDTVDKILDALHEPLDFIFSDTLNGYFVTDALENITIFNQSLFLASVKQEDISFYEFLLESQTFQDYVETKLDEFTKSKSEGASVATIKGGRRRSAFGSGERRRRASTVKKVVKIFD